MSRSRRVCGVAGCPEPALPGSTSCATHRRAGGHRWRKVRNLVLIRDGHRCVICGRRATTVHHTVPLVQGGREFPDLHELESRCDEHNVRGRLQAVE